MQRTGRKHNPVFRVIVAEHTIGPKSGKIVEKLGWYDAKNGKRELEGERIKYWVSNGAKVSGTVHNFLIEEKIIEGTKQNVLPKRKPKEDTSGVEGETPKEEAKVENQEEAPSEEIKKEEVKTEEKMEEEPKAEESKEETQKKEDKEKKE